MRRILRPLGLRHTVVPGDRAGLPSPHAKGYEPLPDLVDATRMNPSLDWAAGEMISTAADLERFVSALLGGKLISKTSLQAMRTTVETGAGFGYGLGLQPRHQGRQVLSKPTITFTIVRGLGNSGF
ncbi:serine hydrolase domain-containing protein [Nonomuraea dietziae]|uniref:serine hydrolase domain-containing protein n=1 Tax=Nonomuraea dietziae TaxID=65515 RepID=UPI003437BFA2